MSKKNLNKVEFSALESDPSEQDCINVTAALELASQKTGKKSRSISIEQNLTDDYDIHIPLQVKKFMKGKLILESKTQMTAEEILKDQEYFNKWLSELTDGEKKCIISMMQEFASQFQKPVPSDEDIEKWVEHEIKMPNGKTEQQFISAFAFYESIIICYRAGLREGTKAMQNGKIPIKTK